MAEKKSFFQDPNTLFGQLRAACIQEWDAYVSHAFVKQLGNGTLPEACFKHYLIQDYLFLIHFARAWALAVYKSETLADMRTAAATLSALLNIEMEMHVKYCEGWGITREEMERTPEARANMAYTRYVLERGLAGDILDLHVALAPCVVGYAEIGARLLSDPATKREHNRYWNWIALYSGDEFQKLAKTAAQQLDKLAAVRMTPSRFENLVKTFRQATLLEIGFWEMGLNLQT